MMKQWNTAGIWTEEQRSWKTTELNAERHFLSGFLDRHELSPGGGAAAQVYSRYGLAQLGAGKVERSKSSWHSLSWCRWKSPRSDQRNWQTVTAVSWLIRQWRRDVFRCFSVDTYLYKQPGGVCKCNDRSVDVVSGGELRRETSSDI